MCKLLIADSLLFSHAQSSLFRNLQQLKTLEVLNCRLLEGIVEDGRGDENSDTNDKIIILFQLLTVTFRDLPNLKSFSHTITCAFYMPKLKYFHLLKCPQLEDMTQIKTSTGLVSVFTEWHKGEELTDLNNCIRLIHKRRSNLVRELEIQISD